MADRRPQVTVRTNMAISRPDTSFRWVEILERSPRAGSSRPTSDNDDVLAVHEDAEDADGVDCAWRRPPDTAGARDNPLQKPGGDALARGHGLDLDGLGALPAVAWAAVILTMHARR